MIELTVSETQKLLHQQHHEAVVKFNYFLLTATGAGIGFAVQKLDGQQFDGAGVTLLVGAGAWLLSFLCGLLSLEASNTSKGIDLQSQMFMDGNHPLSQQFKYESETLAGVVKNWGRTHSKRSRVMTFLQGVFLGIGATCMVVWRVVEMMGRC